MNRAIKSLTLLLTSGLLLMLTGCNSTDASDEAARNAQKPTNAPRVEFGKGAAGTPGKKGMAPQDN